jgi:hypothetical protein
MVSMCINPCESSISVDLNHLHCVMKVFPGRPLRVSTSPRKLPQSNQHLQGIISTQLHPLTLNLVMEAQICM